jgi:uncharacterized repeat protein (TIGR04138 family)
MQKIGFAEALDVIVAEDSRYDREAYIFLRDALDFTMKQLKKSKEDVSRHVSPQQLLEGVRLYALKEFGPMVLTVFTYWGIRNCGDIGEMVFNLIRLGIFGKTEADTIEQFQNAFDFEEAFVIPFRPVKKTSCEKPDQPAHRSE